jgi:hypothetical protein
VSDPERTRIVPARPGHHLEQPALRPTGIAQMRPDEQGVAPPAGQLHDGAWPGLLAEFPR